MLYINVTPLRNGFPARGGVDEDLGKPVRTPLCRRNHRQVCGAARTATGDSTDAGEGAAFRTEYGQLVGPKVLPEGRMFGRF